MSALPIERRAELALLRLFGPGGGMLLDFGGRDDRFVSLSRDDGYDARRASVIDGGPYEVVTAWDPLDRDPDVRASLAMVVGCLVHGGLLLLSTPDVGAPQVARRGLSQSGLSMSTLARLCGEELGCEPLFICASDGERSTLFAIARKGGLRADDVELHRRVVDRDLAERGASEIAWFWVACEDAVAGGRTVEAARAASLDVSLLDAVVTLKRGDVEDAYERIATLVARAEWSREALEWLAVVSRERLRASTEIMRQQQDELASLYRRVDAALAARDAAREEARLLRVSAGYRIGRSMTRVLERLPLAETVWSRLDGLARHGLRYALRPPARSREQTTVAPPLAVRYVPVRAALTPDLVSIVLPVYNQADLVEQSIGSVLRQTYPRFELIIVNDGSTDGIEAVLNRYVGHPNIRIVTQQNQGLPKALSNGFELARGEFWTWTSADNLMVPVQLERMIAFMRSNPDIDMTYADYVRIGDSGHPLAVNSETHLARDPSTLNTGLSNFIGPCFLYRGHVGLAIGDYDPTIGVEDYDYWMRINTLFRIAHLGTEELLYLYRVHDNSLTGRMTEQRIRERTARLARYDEERRRAYTAPVDVAADEGSQYFVKHRGRSPSAHGSLVRVIAGDRLGSGADAPPITDPTIVWFAAGSTACYRLASFLRNPQVVVITTDETVLARVDVVGGRGFAHSDLLCAFDVAIAHLRAQAFFTQTHAPSLRTRTAPAVFGARAIPPCVVLDAPSLADDGDGAVAREVVDLALVMARSGTKPLLVTAGALGAAARRAEGAGLRVEVLPVEGREEAYRALLRRERAQLVNGHDSAMGALAAETVRIPFVYTLHTDGDAVEAAHRAPVVTAFVVGRASLAERLDLAGIPLDKLVLIASGAEAHDRHLDLFDWLITGGLPSAARRWLRSRSRSTSLDFA
jgi:hypothetical protein